MPLIGPGIATLELARLYEAAGNSAEAQKKYKVIADKLAGTAGHGSDGQRCRRPQAPCRRQQPAERKKGSRKQSNAMFERELDSLIAVKIRCWFFVALAS